MDVGWQQMYNFNNGGYSGDVDDVRRNPARTGRTNKLAEVRSDESA